MPPHPPDEEIGDDEARRTASLRVGDPSKSAAETAVRAAVDDQELRAIPVAIRDEAATASDECVAAESGDGDDHGPEQRSCAEQDQELHAKPVANRDEAATASTECVAAERGDDDDHGPEQRRCAERIHGTWIY